MNCDRYDKALERTLAELQKCLLIRVTLLGIERHAFSSNVFTRVINDALFNDYISHAIKIFDRNSQSASFWYLRECTPSPVEKFSQTVDFDLQQLDIVSDKLKIIRDKSHFHIDKKGVKDPKTLWSDAGLTGKELGDAIDFVWGALGTIQMSKGREVPMIPNHYTAEFVQAALVRADTI